MASLTIQNLDKHFGPVRAVDGVNLSVQDGEFVALLGPSGCGKTTTLRMIAGLEIPTGGAIRIGERDVTRMPPRDRDIAMVFQDYALYPHMTVFENVGYPLKVRGTAAPEMDSRVRSVAKNLQIDHLLDRRPAQLSGGQQQRVALARAVVHNAQVTLYDEPLSNLDTKLRLEARAFLKHLQREVGVTSVYVTHDQAEAMAMADHIVVMNQGRIMQVGTPLEIYREPANTFVASFIGSPPMNLLPCTLDVAARRAVFPSGDTISLEGVSHLPSGNHTQVTLGVRPEFVTLHETPTANTIPGRLYVTQMMGSETLVVLHVGENIVSVRLNTDEVPDLPPQLWLEFNPSRMFFYGPDGERLR
jgi:ABC-type sugar transport system ATPase subunit